MRTSSFVILFFAFVIGWISAKLIGQYVFVDNTSYVKIDNSPRTKILVAKTAIPAGQEILAEHINYVDVPVSELPERSISSFKEVYRRRPAFPIPVNCPICEDLLITKDNEKNIENNDKFIPAGYAIISFDVEWLNKRTNLNGNNQLENSQQIDRNQIVERSNQVGSLFVTKNTESENIESGQILKKGNRVDIRVISRRIPKGNLATIKEQVLQTYADKFYIDSVSGLVLENVQIHKITNYGHDAAGNNLQKVSFLLEESKIELLANAAKKGRLRIVASQTEKTDPTQPSEDVTLSQTIAETKKYKGIKSYLKPEQKTKSITTKTTENTNEIAKTDVIPAKIDNSVQTETNKNLATTINVKSTTNENEQEKNLLSTSLAESKSDVESKSIVNNHQPSLFVIPLYLRNFWDNKSLQSQKVENIRAENTGVENTGVENVGVENVGVENVGVENVSVGKEINGFASSNSSRANSDNVSEKRLEKNNVNNQTLVFKRPQIDYSSVDQNNAAGRSSTSKYMIGNNNLNNTDK